MVFERAQADLVRHAAVQRANFESCFVLAAARAEGCGRRQNARVSGVVGVTPLVVVVSLFSLCGPLRRLLTEGEQEIACVWLSRDAASQPTRTEDRHGEDQ